VLTVSAGEYTCMYQFICLLDKWSRTSRRIQHTITIGPVPDTDCNLTFEESRIATKTANSQASLSRGADAKADLLEHLVNRGT